jgi:hypothetical protein
MKNFLRAEDIYSALWPLHFVSRIFALAPYSLRPENKCPIKRKISTCTFRIWSVIWIISLAVSEYNSINKIITANYTIKQKIIEILFYSSTYSSSIILLFLSLTINKFKVPQILDKFSDIDQLFSTKKYGSEIYKNTRLLIIVQFTVVISTVVALFSFNMYINRHDFAFFITSDVFFQYLCVVLNSTVTLHFVDLVFLLRDKYKYLNSELESSTLTLCKVTNVNYLNTNSMTPIENSTVETITSITELRENSILSRRNHLRNLRIIYSQLYEVVFLINSTYGIPLLCATFWVLITIVSGANYSIDLKHTDHFYVIQTVLWSIFCVILMITIAIACSLTVSECNRSPVLVQKVMLRNDIDSETLNEMEKMFTQFQVMNIGFSACGMFRIDLSLLCGIFGATLSYLLIVPQM